MYDIKFLYCQNEPFRDNKTNKIIFLQQRWARTTHTHTPTHMIRFLSVMISKYLSESYKTD